MYNSMCGHTNVGQHLKHLYFMILYVCTVLYVFYVHRFALNIFLRLKKHLLYNMFLFEVQVKACLGQEDKWGVTL